MFVRTLGAFLAGFALLNLLGDLLWQRFDANLWWIDLRWLPPWMACGLIGLAGMLLLAWAFKPDLSRTRRNVTLLATGALLLCAMINALGFWLLLWRRTIRAPIPLPFSLLIAATIGFVLLHMIRTSSPPASRERRWIGAVSGAALFLLGFPLGQMFLFGKTDYSRPADVIVVLGARTYADGRPSDALADRVRTACELYHQGLAPTLLMSGGSGDGPVHETEAMRDLAIELGVPAAAILLDRDGVNTRATAGNVTRILRLPGAPRVLAVSHFYHLPRVKLSFARQGLEVWTVPARERYILSKMPLLMAREIVALWAYYLQIPRPGQ